MSSPPDPGQPAADPSEADGQTQYHEQYQALEAESYTAYQLHHASANHLHMTSRRFFIGPIPEGWLNSHRKSWYQMGLSFKNYTSRRVTFSADPSFTEQTQATGQNDESVAVVHGGFPQLDGIESEEETDDPSGEPEERGRETATGAQQVDISTSDQAAETQEAEGSRPVSRDDDQAESSQARHLSPLDQKDPDPDPSAQDTTQEAQSSYFTAREAISDGKESQQSSSGHHAKKNTPKQRFSKRGSKKQQKRNVPPVQKLSPVASMSEAGSATSLLGHRERAQPNSDNSEDRSRDLQQQEPQADDIVQDGNYLDTGRADRRLLTPLSSRLARFNLDDNVLDKQQRMLSRISRTHESISGKRPRRRKPQEGEIIKAEKMLVRVEETMQKILPDDYSENDSLKIETRVLDKWREYLVVCRQSSQKHTRFTLQMQKTRVIPKVQTSKTRKAARHDVPLNYKNTRVNLYSSLDKTLVIWQPFNQGTRMYIMRARSAAHSIEWYTFIRQALGWRRPSSLLINVPDLGVSLIFKHPFRPQEPNSDSENEERQEHGVLTMTAAEERFASATIIRSCMEMLKNRAEWSDVLNSWSKFEKMGLAWKRYDRLEWVLGINEKNMYGTIAMQMSHDLELRPKHHYPTAVKRQNEDKEQEPPPVEGFLIRLTSQKGVHQRFNKMFFKRLYFSTQDHYLCFCRPARAAPPPPPRLLATRDSNVPSSREIVQEMPLQYDVDPFPIQDGNIAWLSSGNKEYVRDRDQEAYAQVQRNLHNLTESEGFINLCRVQEVRYIQRGSSPADPNIREGPDVDFHREVTDTHRDDGATKQFDDDRTFEMALDNGLVVRLQAYNTATRDEWMKRLDALVKYWKARTASDSAEQKVVRQRNLELLDIDEEMESIMGQFARKWEVRRAQASPHLYNMCTLTGCRAIKMAGQLYRKPRRHATFTRCNVLVTNGKLLIFKSTLRKRTGVEVPHIHQELHTTLDLSDCYIYSGLLTESDLLYANRTFDSNHPGHHALPRIYLSTDGWTSCDEDTALCFVIWHPLRKSLFRAPEAEEDGRTRQTLRQVSMLGVPGRTVVFKARSRVERDRWVMSIESEIDRLQEARGEDIRIFSDS